MLTLLKLAAPQVHQRQNHHEQAALRVLAAVLHKGCGMAAGVHAQGNAEQGSTGKRAVQKSAATAHGWEQLLERCTALLTQAQLAGHRAAQHKLLAALVRVACRGVDGHRGGLPLGEGVVFRSE